MQALFFHSVSSHQRIRMPDILKTNKEFLALLCKTKSSEQRQVLLDTATPTQIRALSEIVLNLYCHRIHLPFKKRKLQEHRFELSRIGAKNRPYGQKKRILVEAHKSEINNNQRGEGLFSVLIPLLASVIGSAVAGS